ncbi:MAG TPA: hypothetical protein IGS31_05025, partial [Oscillatoriales cyanobacterium M4454_W2019_049]|nr:hypothetical protein [Oscillatoriales cyanobacterium M4454_W2019_049]
MQIQLLNALKDPILIARKSPVFWVFISGVAMGCTVAPLEWWMLAWVALIPLWIVLCRSDTPEGSRLRDQSLLNLGLLALVWGIGYDGVALFWITGIHPMTWMGVPWLPSLGIALFCW